MHTEYELFMISSTTLFHPFFCHGWSGLNVQVAFLNARANTQGKGRGDLNMEAPGLPLGVGLGFRVEGVEGCSRQGR